MRDTITCKTTLNRISKIFKSISESLAPNQRHFKEVRLNQHRNEREFILEDNSFGDITFDTFFADKGIRKISSNAFNKTANKITTFHCVDCQLEHQPPKYHIENVFNQMTQLETLSTQFITEIPYLQSSKLANLLIKVHQNLIIKSSTFYNLNQLINLIIYETKILRIEKEAFKFSKNLDQRMRIRFDRCNLTGKKILKPHYN